MSEDDDNELNSARKGRKKLDNLMKTVLLVVLLASASTCQGVALPDRLKKEAIDGKLDYSFDLFGAHMGLKYKDVAIPLMGGNLHIKVDDLQKIFKM